MVTSVVFLDWLRALWAWFGVCDNPCDIFRFCRILLVPFLHVLAIGWRVGLHSTLEAELLPTLTVHHCQTMSILGSLYTNITVLVGTPLYIFVVICKSFAVPLFILFKCRSLKISIEKRMRNDTVAPILHTHRMHRVWAFVHFVFEIFDPATFAELVLALGYAHTLKQVVIELIIANDAVPLVLLSERHLDFWVILCDFCIVFETNSFLQSLVIKPLVLQFLNVELVVPQHDESFVFSAVEELAHFISDSWNNLDDLIRFFQDKGFSVNDLITFPISHVVIVVAVAPAIALVGIGL
jgi:hypothetical protein